MADYGRVAGQQGQAVVTAEDGSGRVAGQQGQAIVTAEDGRGRLAGQQGQAIVAADSEFRVSNMFVEVFVTFREVKPNEPSIQGDAIQRGLGSLSGARRRR